MRFAEFEIDPETGVLRRDGVRIKLQELPCRLLIALLRKPGTLITRDELRAELWGAETFVDAEAGLNTAVGKIRDALGDNADTPTFIETLPKRGYRFIGTLAADTTLVEVTDGIQPAAPPSAPRSQRRGWMVVVAPAVLAIGVAGYSAYVAATRVTIAVVRFHNETGRAEYDRLAGTLTDAVVVSLAQNARYGVIGNSPLLRTDRIFEDVQRIGTALGADFVVLGQLQQGDAGLLARGHFIRVSDQKHLWAGKIELGGVTDLEHRVTTAIADGVGAGLTRR